MKTSFKKLSLIIFMLLIGSGAVYSQTKFWEPVGELPGAVAAITVSNNGDVWASAFCFDTYMYYIYVSTDNGDTWIQKDSTIHLIRNIAINPENDYMFASASNGGILRSTDKGNNWILLTSNTAAYSNIIITTNGGIYSAFASSVCYSSNNGDSWSRKDGGLYVYSLGLGTDGILYAGTHNAGIHRSTNGGDDWLPSSNYNSARIISDFAFPNDDLILAATENLGVLKSTDKGITWEQSNTGFNTEDTSFYKIIYNPVTKHVFVSSASGNVFKIYKSTNLGESWGVTDIDLADKKSIYLYGFAVNPITGMMFAATDEGIYRSTSGTISVNECSKDIPTEYTLSQNYPNPFNPTTVIKYQIPEAAQVSLKVYDVMGKEVATLVNSYQARGSYDVTFNANGLSSGIYFYKLNANGVQLINKMLLMK